MKAFYKSNKDLEKELMIQSVRQSVVRVAKEKDPPRLIWG